jgi:hypothetical protein
MEMRVVVQRVLERAALSAADPQPEQVQFRAITLSPRNGTRVVQTRAPFEADLTSQRSARTPVSQAR